MTFALVLLLGAGCTQVIRPPHEPTDPTKVYVADYGLHSSLFLPQPSPDGRYADDGPYVEYAFGDWPFMALGRHGVLNVLSAIFVSPQAALGRRGLWIEGDGVPLGTVAAPDRLTCFYAARADVGRLRAGLDARHRRNLHTAVTNASDDTVYVKDPEHYWFAHNCNHVTLRWLGKLGCDVRGLLPTSHFRAAR
jgi:hypothetical protein